jgi:hypothetical protein
MERWRMKRDVKSFCSLCWLVVILAFLLGIVFQRQVGLWRLRAWIDDARTSWGQPLVTQAPAQRDDTPKQKLRYPIRVEKISQFPLLDSGEVYKDCNAVFLCSGAVGDVWRNFELILPVMRSRELLLAVDLQIGDRLQAVLREWQDASDAVKTMRIIDSVERVDLERYFAEKWTCGRALRSVDSNSVSRAIANLQGSLLKAPLEEWLFYLPKKEIYRPRFWARSDSEGAADPLGPITEFARDLGALGIRLLVVPMPNAASIYPDVLLGRPMPKPWRANEHVGHFCSALNERGVHCLDITPTFLQNRYIIHSGERYPIYRKNDTHFAPYAARMAASIIASEIRRERGDIVSESQAVTSIRASVASRPGDLSEFSELKALRYSVPQEMVPEFKVETDEPDLLVRDHAASGVCLLGDSFASVYGDASLHAHLENELGKSVYLLAIAGGGVNLARREFVRQKLYDRVNFVVWVISERYLGDNFVRIPFPPR